MLQLKVWLQHIQRLTCGWHPASELGGSCTDFVVPHYHGAIPIIGDAKPSLVLLLSWAGWKLPYVYLQWVAIMLLIVVWKQTKRNETKLSLWNHCESCHWAWLYWKRKQHGAQGNSFVGRWTDSALFGKDNWTSFHMFHLLRKSFFWPGLRKPHGAGILCGTRGCVWHCSWVWKLNSFSPDSIPKLTEQPSFTITCHPNKLQGRDTSHLNQLLAASEQCLGNQNTLHHESDMFNS